MAPTTRTPRVLLVSTVEAWPVTGGTGRRVASMVEELRLVFALEVFVSTHTVVQGAAPPTGLAVCRVPRSRSRLSSILSMIAAAPTARPLVFGFYRRRHVRRELRRRVAEFEPDVVIAQGIGSLGLCESAVPRRRQIYDTSDALHETFASLGRSLRGPAGWQWRLDAPLLRRWFRRHLAEYAAVVVVSEHDRASYEALAPDARYLLVPNGATPRSAERLDQPTGSLVFVGGLDYEPNRDGLRWFVDCVLDHCPDGLRLRAIGTGTPPGHPRVDGAGYVPDIDVEWDGAIASVVPTFAGGGTHLKVVEALAAGVPVISTTFGARGLPLVDGVHFLRADSDAEFVGAIQRIWSDPQLRGSLSRNGRELVQRQLSWASAMRPLMEAIAEVTSGLSPDDQSQPKD